MDFNIVDEENINIILYENNEEKAKATCFYKNTPIFNGKEIGTIGEFEADSIEYGKALIDKCLELLKNKGIDYAVGPMNGNTWKQYRTLKFSNGEPLFALENVGCIEQNEMFTESGFKEIYLYSSTKGNIKNAYESDTLEEVKNRIEQDGISIRNFNKNDYLKDLKKIYKVSLKSFCKNPLYTPINEESFIKQYEKYIQMCDEELILLAEKNDETIGFLFSIPNFNELKEQGKITTIILKTIAVLPEYEDYSIGNVLTNMIKQTAINKEYENWIFAFMYKSNTSQRMAKRNNTETIREYALYGKEI